MDKTDSFAIWQGVAKRAELRGEVMVVVAAKDASSFCLSSTCSRSSPFSICKAFSFLEDIKCGSGISFTLFDILFMVSALSILFDLEVTDEDS